MEEKRTFFNPPLVHNSDCAMSRPCCLEKLNLDLRVLLMYIRFV